MKFKWWPFKKKSNTRLYGRNHTIHQTSILNVETDDDGKVVAVWFRCQPLPFDQTIVQNNRADEMDRMYLSEMPQIVAVELDDPKH